MQKSIISKKYKPSQKEKLINWRKEILKESYETIHNLQISENLNKPDIADRASLETDKTIELRNRDRERKLLNKINNALKKIGNGTYGYCEETSEPISIKRLDARPIATLSIEAQERHERMEKIRKDD